MYDALFSILGSAGKAVGLIQHIESLMINILVGLEGDSKNSAIDGIVAILQSHKIGSALAPVIVPTPQVAPTPTQV